MANLQTNYMGLQLRNPLIAESSGLTNSVENIKEFAEKGIGAIIASINCITNYDWHNFAKQISRTGQ